VTSRGDSEMRGRGEKGRWRRPAEWGKKLEGWGEPEIRKHVQGGEAARDLHIDNLVLVLAPLPRLSPAILCSTKRSKCRKRHQI
jgi:hypothetical protein